MLNKKLTTLTLLTLIFAAPALYAMMPNPRNSINKLHAELHAVYNKPFSALDERVKNLKRSSTLCNRLLAKYSNNLRKNPENDSYIIVALKHLQENVWLELENLKES